jgi:hypothetical protein
MIGGFESKQTPLLNFLVLHDTLQIITLANKSSQSVLPNKFKIASISTNIDSACRYLDRLPMPCNSVYFATTLAHVCLGMKISGKDLLTCIDLSDIAKNRANAILQVLVKGDNRNLMALEPKKGIILTQDLLRHHELIQRYK